MEARYDGFSHEEKSSTSLTSLAYSRQHGSWTARLLRSSAIFADWIKLIRRCCAAWAPEMMFRGSQRALLYAFIAVTLLLIIFVPQTTLPQKTIGYVNKALGYEEEKPVFNSDRWCASEPPFLDGLTDHHTGSTRMS